MAASGVHSIGFTVRRDTKLGVSWVTPTIDGRSLRDLISSYESAQGYSPGGAYDGLVPEHFDFGDLHEHLLGRGSEQSQEPGHASVLGCDCGEVGCWPLDVAVTVTTNEVTWSRFAQPHRPEWDYSGFGSFTFDRSSYEAAVADLVTSIR